MTYLPQDILNIINEYVLIHQKNKMKYVNQEFFNKFYWTWNDNLRCDNDLGIYLNYRNYWNYPPKHVIRGQGPWNNITNIKNADVVATLPKNY